MKPTINSEVASQNFQLNGFCSKFAFWVKMPKIDWPGSQDFQHLANFSLIWGCL